MLYYIPLEQIPERYTFQLSKPVDGWMEKNFIAMGVPYTRVDGTTDVRSITTGRVLDAARRSEHCFEQTVSILKLMEVGVIKNSDTLYFDDFWHPGIEAIAYLGDQIGVRPRMFSFLWAQSVDEFDFTYSMLPWIRDFEKGIAKLMTGIFVCSSVLQDLVCKQDLAPKSKVHVVGLPTDNQEIASRMKHGKERQNRVLFTSRWDKEKDPRFFLRVAKEYKRNYTTPCDFVVTTSAPMLRSNDPGLVMDLRCCIEDEVVQLLEGLSKEQYYSLLCNSKIQFNCADQDFVSFTLIEASIAGAYPVYPNFRSFPLILPSRCLYHKGDVTDAVKLIASLLHNDYDLWSDKELEKRKWIHEQWGEVIPNMIRKMNLWEG